MWQIRTKTLTIIEMYVCNKITDKEIYVVGHSMGGVLASYVASRHKEIKKWVLVNAAFNYINLKQNNAYDTFSF